MSGFESVGKAAEEASPEFQSRNFAVAIILTIFVGLAFFFIVISAVSFVAPWQTLAASIKAVAVRRSADILVRSEPQS